jgi:hypothetical protein
MGVVVTVGWLGATLPLVAGANPATLVVRTYNAVRITTPELTAAHAAARTILNDAGIDIEWRNCGPVVPSGPLSSSCEERVRADETVVRIVASGPQAVADSLGYSVVDVQNTGCLVTIFGDRITATAARAKVEPGPLLGRAIAHEIGHLLLGTAHSSAGLMRAHWYDDELQRDLKSDWMLSDLEARRMRHALVERSRIR